MVSSAAYKTLDTQLRGNRFNSNLEEYIDRTRHGLDKGNTQVPEQLGTKLSLSNNYLANTDPKLLRKYSAYMTGMGYDKRGRFVSNLDDSFSHLATLSKSA